MLYVVENGQSNHFTNLFSIVKSISQNEDGKASTRRMEHVKFGRISGMSSRYDSNVEFSAVSKMSKIVLLFRKGTAVFLSDILDEAKERMRAQTEASKNSRLSGDVSDQERILDILATTAVVG